MGQLVKLVAVLVVIAVVLGGAAFFLLGDSGGASRTSALDGIEGDDAGAVPDAMEVGRPTGDSEVSRTEEAAPAIDVDGAGTAAAPYIPRSAFLAGRVVDGEGAPVVDAEVTFGVDRGPFRGFGGPDQPDQESSGRTGSDGRFRLDNVSRKGGLALKIAHPDYLSLTRGSVHLTARGMDLGTLTMTRGAVVSGTVFGPGGKPQAGAEVSFRADPESLDERGLLGAMGMEFLMGGGGVQTDSAGRFRLGGLPSMVGHVIAKHGGLADGQSELLTPVAGQESFGVVLNMAHGLAIHGLVLDSGGQPVPGAKITWTSPRTGPFMIGMPDTEDGVQTGDDGRFSLDGLNPGTYRVTARAEGLSSDTMQGVRAGETEPITLTLAGAGGVVVVVQDAVTGDAVPDARFNTRNVQHDFFSGLPGSGEVAADKIRIQEDGSYVIDGLEAGKYTLTVEAPGYASGRSDPFDVRSELVAEGITIQLQNAAVLAGVVLEAGSRQPVAGARVKAREVTQRQREGNFVEMRLSSADGMSMDYRVHTRKSATTGADGRFALDGLGAGTYELLVQHPDHAAAWTEHMEIEKGERRQDLEFLLTEGGAVEGVVLKLDGTPSAGDTITIQCDSATEVSQSATTDGAGYYRIDHVAAGDYTARRKNRGHAGGSRLVFAFQNEQEGPGKQFMMEEGQLVQIDFSEAEKPYLHGKVTSAAGPVDSARVRIFPLGDEDHFAFNDAGNATTDDTGYYKIPDIKPGSYRIEVMHPRAVVPTTGQVDLGDAAPVTQDFHLEGGVVRGRVLGVDGQGLGDATVRLEKVTGDEDTRTFSRMMFVTAGGGGGGPMLHTMTGTTPAKTASDGSFTIEWVPDGKYKLVGNHPAHIEARTEAFEIQDHGEVKGLELGLSQAGTILVVATMKETGRPAVQKFIQVRSEEGDGGHNIMVTDEEGHARIEGLEPGQWTVESPGFFGEAGPEAQDATVVAGRETRVTLEF